MSPPKSSRRSALASEAEILAWLERRPATGGHLGDDAAVLALDGEHAVTVDQQIAGIHFPADLDPSVLARRLLAVNLSDVAAMGARPRYAFLALAAPASFAHRRFFTSLLRACTRNGVELAGGDLAACDTIHLSLTLIAEPWPEGEGWVRRRGAEPGDRIWIGPGGLGESALGLELVRRGARPQGRSIRLAGVPGLPPDLAGRARRAVRRHLLPVPQLELGRWLAAQSRATGTDVSDGLARDLSHLCAKGRVGALVRERCLSLDENFVALARRLALSPLDLVLGGGEDYVLLFSLRPHERPPASLRCREIGVFDAGEGVRLEHRDGHVETLPALGWDHLARRSAQR